MSNCLSQTPLVAALKKWQTRGARCILQCCLSTQVFGVFCGFLRNSRKYGLGSLTKTPTEGIPPQAQVPMWKFGLIPTINQPTQQEGGSNHPYWGELLISKSLNVYPGENFFTFGIFRKNTKKHPKLMVEPYMCDNLNQIYRSTFFFFFNNNNKKKKKFIQKRLRKSSGKHQIDCFRTIMIIFCWY